MFGQGYFCHFFLFLVVPSHILYSPIHISCSLFLGKIYKRVTLIFMSFNFRRVQIEERIKIVHLLWVKAQSDS